MSRCCIATAVDNLAEQLTLIRSAPGNYDAEGRWQDFEPETVMVTGTVQPLRSEEISRLEDSRHIAEAIKIYTTSNVRNMSLKEHTQPDTIIRNGVEFEVYSSADWGAYLKILAVRKE